MTSDMELVVTADGVARGIYDETLDLREIGKLRIDWASQPRRARLGRFLVGRYGTVRRAGVGTVREPVGGVGGGEGVACCSRQPIVRLTCFRYFAGVMPVSSLKSRVKWLCDEKPSSRAVSASGLE